MRAFESMEPSDFFLTETGASTGDARENDPRQPGYTEEPDRLFRSLFQHANHLADYGYEDVRPAYQAGYDAARDPRFVGHGFEQIEEDLEGGWLNVRLAHGEWQAVRDDATDALEHGRQIGRISESEPAGETPSHQRASFSDPIAGGIDPTAPDRPE